MLKFFIGIIIIAFCSFCGWLLSKKYRQRKLFFHEFKEFNERFLSEISYYRRPLREFITAYAYQGEFQQFLSNAFLARRDDTKNESVFREIDKLEFLKNEEKYELQDYFLMLGKGDSGSQKNYFTSYKEKLSSLTQSANLDAKRYGDLYIKLGFLSGLFILLLII